MTNYNKSITVAAPGTVANLVCGFDILGLCLSQPADTMTLTLLDQPEIIIESADGYPLPTDPAKNTAGAPLLAMQQQADTPVGFHVQIRKTIKPGSGLGSSAASAAGAAVAANLLLGNRWKKQELVRFAMLGEQVASGVQHADNVAPCIYGGITLIRSAAPLDIIALPAPDIYVSLVHPQIEIRTADARAILKQQTPLKTAIRQWGNVAGLVAGICLSDYELMGRSLEDHIIEPLRSQLIPGFHEVKAQAKECGALGGGISGSGPSLFMLSKDQKTALAVEEAMKAVYTRLGIDFYTYVSKVNKEGVRLVAP